MQFEQHRDRSSMCALCASKIAIYAHDPVPTPPPASIFACHHQFNHLPFGSSFPAVRRPRHQGRRALTPHTWFRYRTLPQSRVAAAPVEPAFRLAAGTAATSRRSQATTSAALRLPCGGKNAAIGNARVFPGRVRKPKTPHIFDAIVRHVQRHAKPLFFHVDSCDRGSGDASELEHAIASTARTGRT